MRTELTPSWVAGWAVYPADAAPDTRLFEYETAFGEKVVLWADGPGDSILIPRAACPPGVEDFRTDGDAVDVEARGEPRNKDQERVIREASRLMLDGESFVLRAPTGWGKTMAACHLLARYARTTLVIVPKTDLMEQWRERLLQFTSLTPDDIGTVQGDECVVSGRKVVLGMLHSLAKPDRYPGWIYDSFGLVVWDEVHKLPAETFSYTAGLFPARVRLGLSATPYRRDGKDRTVTAHIGPVRVEAKQAVLAPKVGVYRSPWRTPRTWNGAIVPHEAGRTMHIEKTMVHHKDRNALLLSLIKKAYDRGRATVVFASIVEHLETLRRILTQELGVPLSDTSLYTGKLAKGKRPAALTKRVVFATYQMMDLGTDVPWLDCCVLATPRSNIEQAVGRILREYPDKPTPVVLDVVDDDCRLFEGYGLARRKFYRKIGAEVTDY